MVNISSGEYLGEALRFEARILLLLLDLICLSCFATRMVPLLPLKKAQVVRSSNESIFWSAFFMPR